MNYRNSALLCAALWCLALAVVILSALAVLIFGHSL